MIHYVDDVLSYAFVKKPCLIIDCANTVDPHKLFPRVLPEEMHDVYVVNAEAIYRFRDVLRNVGRWKEKLRLRSLVITPVRTLFSYDDETENRNVLEHCQEIIDDLDMEVYMEGPVWAIP